MIKLMTAKELREEIAEKKIEAEAIVALAEAEERDLTAEEQASLDAILGVGKEGQSNYRPGEIANLEEKLDQAEKREAIIAEARQARSIQNRIDSGELSFGDQSETSIRNRITVPARAKATKKLVAFEDERDAFVAGHLILANIFGSGRSRQWCDSNGFSNAMVEGDVHKGGFLVPDEMSRAITRLREERGVFSRYARSYPMGSDQVFIPRDLTDVTAYWVGENSAITESDKQIDGAELVAKKLAALVKVSTELDEDSVVDIGDMITTSMAYKMADKIDEAGFNGDGTSTYGGITGLKNALHANATYDAASGNVGASSLDLADFEGCAGLLPQYDGMQPVWFVHSRVWHASMLRLMNATGGTTGSDIASGQRREFLGYPVQFVQVLPSTPGDSASTILAYLGDLRLAATVGNRRAARTQVSLDRYFESDMIGIKMTERIAVNVHERGDTDNNRPIVALKTAGS